MNSSSDTKQHADVRDYLAAERTFLAWIRTGLALMGFGFVVARFGLFLQQLQFLQKGTEPPSTGLSLWFGTALIVIGVFVNLCSAWSHFRLVRQFDSGNTDSPRPMALPFFTAIFLALVGLAMAIYLVSVRESANNHSQNSEYGEVRPMVAQSRGIIDKPSNHSVNETVDRLKEILQAKGVTLFAVVDHSGEAEKVGMKMPPTKLLIFGNPKAGTPLMLAAPSSAIDLPLKILVWEDGQGKVWVSYNNADYIKERHNLPQDLMQNIAVVETLATKSAE
jgi:uncharacterized protein (DUF302 family)/uncharacterized membrane protein YidH (DUF202 family)